MNIAIIGTGVYGISMAIALSKNKNNNIIMWTESDKTYSDFSSWYKSCPLLNNIKIPKSIKITKDYSEALKRC